MQEAWLCSCSARVLFCGDFISPPLRFWCFCSGAHELEWLFFRGTFGPFRPCFRIASPDLRRDWSFNGVCDFRNSNLGKPLEVSAPPPSPSSCSGASPFPKVAPERSCFDHGPIFYSPYSFCASTLSGSFARRLHSHDADAAARSTGPGGTIRHEPGLPLPRVHSRSLPTVKPTGAMPSRDRLPPLGPCADSARFFRRTSGPPAPHWSSRGAGHEPRSLDSFPPTEAHVRFCSCRARVPLSYSRRTQHFPSNKAFMFGEQLPPGDRTTEDRALDFLVVFLMFAHWSTSLRRW